MKYILILSGILAFALSKLGQESDDEYNKLVDRIPLFSMDNHEHV